MRFKIVLLLVFSSCMSLAQVEHYKLYNISSDEGLLSDYVEYIYQDSYGFFWIANFEGLSRWDGHSFKRYQHSDKDSSTLSQNIVYCIMEDHQKRLWIGTIGGLDLYDREKDQFVHCKINPTTERIPVNAMAEDSKHRLWLGTSTGLCHYAYETGKAEWFHQDEKDGLSDQVIFALDIDSHDNLWLGTFNGGVNCFSADSKKVTPYFHQEGNAKTICSNKIKSICVDHEDHVWIGTFNKGVSVLDQQGKVIQHYQFSDQTKSSDQQNLIYRMYEDKNQMLWVGAINESVKYLDRKNNRFIALNTPAYKKEAVTCRSVSSMCEDSFGNLWFGSIVNGLLYTNENKNSFRYYYKEKDPSQGLINNVVTCFYEDEKSNIWIGTDGGGLSLFDKRKNKFTHYTTANGLSSNAIHDIKGDEQGNLWLSTWSGGIIRFNPESGKKIIYVNNPKDKNSVVYNNSKSILLDDTLLWIGTHGEGISIYNLKKNTFTDHRNNHQFSFDLKAPAWINHLYKDYKGRIWIGAYGGLFVYDGKTLQKFTHTKDTTSIAHNDVNMIAEDNTKQLWVITEGGGLDRYDEHTASFIHYSERYHLPRTLKSIVADDRGWLWLGSNEGLVAFHPQTKQVRRYNVSDGLQGNFFFLKAVLKAKTGELYFGGKNGFNVFYPDSLQNRATASDFYFTDLSIFDRLQKPGAENSPISKSLSFLDTLKLSYDQSFFTIAFTDINLFSPSKTMYAYKLSGLYDQWISIQNERQVSFTNLPAGNYRLKIKYTLANGDWIEANKVLFIQILPPWWKTWWFRLIAGLSIIASVVIVFYLRLTAVKNRNQQLEQEVKKQTQQLSDANNDLTERNEEIKNQNERLEEYNDEITRQSDKILNQQKYILEQNSELEETVVKLSLSDKTKNLFFNILAHDLKGPISAINGLSDLLVNNINKLNKTEILEFTQHIQSSSVATNQLLINLLNWARTQSNNIEYRPQALNLYDLVQQNIVLLQQQLLNKGIVVTNKVDLSHTIYVDFNMMDTVIRNLISNSIKFTAERGEVTIDSEDANEEVLIHIRDTGIGMSEEQLNNLFRIDTRNYSKGTDGETGTGLGLMLSKEFVTINKGQIQVASELSRGTTFSLYLPKSNSPQQAVYELNLQKQVANKNQSLLISEEEISMIKGKRILIVDDNEEVRHHLRWMLSGMFEIVEAENGKEGLEIASDFQPMVIITDMIMPVMDGLEFCKEIKNDSLTCHIPVIILTSQNTEEGQLSGYHAGADIYISKPARQDILFQIILNILQNQENIRQRLNASDDIIPGDFPLNPLDNGFLDKVVLFIETHISDQNLDAQEIGKHMAMSRSVLYAKFKTITGQGVNEFIRMVRLKKSVELLRGTTLTINEVAYEVGFNSASYYIRCFVKQYHVTPKEYRQQ